MRHRLVHFSLSQQDIAHLHARLGIVGISFQRFLEHGLRLVQFPACSRALPMFTHPSASLGATLSASWNSASASSVFPFFSRALPYHAGLAVIGTDFKGLLKLGQRFVRPSLMAKIGPEIAVGYPASGVLVQRKPIQSVSSLWCGRRVASSTPLGAAKFFRAGHASRTKIFHISAMSELI